MNNEIKEFIEFRADEDGTYFYYIDKNGDEQWSYNLDNLKDYITNLQQEIQKKEAMYDSLAVDYRLAQEENERLKEENKHIFSKVNDDELLISNAMNYAEAQDYKSKVEKAVEYIKKDLSLGVNTFGSVYSIGANEVLNILQNGSGEE